MSTKDLANADFFFGAHETEKAPFLVVALNGASTRRACQPFTLSLKVAFSVTLMVLVPWPRRVTTFTLLLDPSPCSHW